MSAYAERELSVKKLSGIESYFKLPKTIYMLLIAKMINQAGTFVMPFLTLFLTLSLGIGAERAGMYVMLASLASAPGSILGGKLCDSLGRKKVFILFQVLSALLMILCAFFDNMMVIPFLIILASFSIAVAQPAVSTMIIDSTNQDNRKIAFSLQYWGSNTALAIGYSIAGYLFSRNTKLLFLGNAAATLLSLIPVIIFVRETKGGIKEAAEVYNEDEKAEEGNFIHALLKRPVLICFAVISIVYSFVYSQYSFSIPIQINNLFKNNGSEIYGSVMTVNALTITFATIIITRITQKLKPILNIAVSGLLYAIGFGMLFYAGNYMLLVVSTVIWSIGEILQTTNTGVYIADHSPSSHRGRFNAIIPMISNSGFTIGPALMGYYIKFNGVKMVWPLLFLLSIFASALMYLLYMRDKRRKRSA